MISSARRYEPSHTLALARETWFRPSASIHLDNSQAISFLAGESLRGLEAISTPRMDPRDVEWTANRLGKILPRAAQESLASLGSNHWFEIPLALSPRNILVMARETDRA
jgi:hypothetical protein